MKTALGTVSVLLLIVSISGGAERAPASSLADRLSATDYRKRLDALSELAQSDFVSESLYQKIVDAAVDTRKPKDQKDAAMQYVVYLKAIEVMVRIGSPVVPPLREHMKNDQTRWHAVSVLQRLGPTAVSALPELIEALKDKNEHVRYFAAKTIMQLGPDAAAAVDGLIPLIDDEHDSPQEYAIKALGEIGSAAAKSLPTLRKPRKYRDPLMGDYVAEAIEKIEGAR